MIREAGGFQALSQAEEREGDYGFYHTAVDNCETHRTCLVESIRFFLGPGPPEGTVDNKTTKLYVYRPVINHGNVCILLVWGGEGDHG
jgi:hypothetical protein